MTRAGLVALVQRIIDADGPDEEVDAVIASFLRAVPHPEALNILGRFDVAGQVVDATLAGRRRARRGRRQGHRRRWWARAAAAHGEGAHEALAELFSSRSARTDDLADFFVHYRRLFWAAQHA